MIELKAVSHASTNTSIEDSLRTYFVDLMGLTELPSNDTALAEKGYVVSAQLLELVDFIEERFGVVLRPIDVLPENLATIGTIARTIRSRLSA